MMLSPGTHVTAQGREWELVVRAKCGPQRGWFANPCVQGTPIRERERWIADDEITAVLTKKGQYVLPTEEA